MGRVGVAALATLALGCGLGAASADLRRIEDFAVPGRFQPLWRGGASSEGASAGRHWIEIHAGAAGAAPEHVVVANVAAYQPALDLRGRFLEVAIRIDDLRRIGGLELRLASESFERGYFAFAFPRYGDLDSNFLREGIWNRITFPFASARVTGAPDRARIDRIGLYLANSDAGPAVVQLGGIAALDEPSEGVVSFTFDDGYDEHLWAAAELARFGMRGTAYVIRNGIGKPGYLTEAQLRELDERYGWEIAAHHETPFTEFGAALESNIDALQNYLRGLGFARGARHLAYPLGKQDPIRVRPAVNAHFDSARIAGGGLETLPPADPHLLRVVNVVRSTQPADLAAAAREARRDRHWLILMFHYLVDQPQQDTDYARADFQELVRGVHESGVRVSPLIEIFEACGELGASSCRLPEARERNPRNQR
jgi:peptidoglycan/xylan/chitin deacetylase (PgdA/CDA1 family)